MQDTIITRIQNGTNSELILAHLDSGDTIVNRYVDPNETDNLEIIVPHAASKTAFLSAGIVINNLLDSEVIGYLWQDEGDDGDHVRFTTTGWEDPNVMNEVPGSSEPGPSKVMIINGPGDVRFV